MTRGSALPMTLYALAFIGALIVGASFVAREHDADTRLWQRSAELEPAVDRLLVSAVVAWDSAARGSQRIGQTDPITAGVWATRLSPTLFWVVAESVNGTRPVLRRRFGVLLTTKSGSPALVPGRAWGELP